MGTAQEFPMSQVAGILHREVLDVDGGAVMFIVTIELFGEELYDFLLLFAFMCAFKLSHEVLHATVVIRAEALLLECEDVLTFRPMGCCHNSQSPFHSIGSCCLS